MDHHEFTHVFGCEKADQFAGGIEHGQRGAAGLLHDGEGAIKGHGRMHARDIHAHGVAREAFRARFAQRHDEIVAREQAMHFALGIHDGKLVLRSAEQRLDGLIQRGVERERAEVRDHRGFHAHAGGDGFHLGDRRFAFRAEIDEDGDEDEHRVHRILHERPEAEGEGARLADAGGNVRGARVIHAHGERGAEDASAVHGKGRDEIEKDEADIYDEQVHRHTRADMADSVQVSKAAGDLEIKGEHGGDSDIDERASDGDDDFLDRVIGHALKPREAADREQRNIRRANAVAACGKGVAEFVQEHAAEDEAREDEAGNGGGQSALAPVGGAEEGEQEKKRGVNADFDSSDAGDFEGPGHVCEKTRSGQQTTGNRKSSASGPIGGRAFGVERGPSPGYGSNMMSTERTQRLVEEVSRRQQIAAFAARLRWGMLGAAAAYFALLLVARLLALLPNWFTPLSLCVIPATALVYALVFVRRIPAKQTARLIDERTGSKELFLTAAMIEQSPGDYGAIVLQQAEARAAELQPVKVLPFLWQRGFRDVAAAGAIVAVATLFLPQLDPFKKEEERRKTAKEEERLRETKKITALRAAQIAETPKSGQIEKALAELEKTFQAAKPQERETNLKKLGEHQKELGEMWRKASNETPKETFEKSGQGFGQADPKKAEEFREELKKGETAAVKKEMQELGAEMKKLAAMPEGAEKRALREQLQQKLNALAEGLKQQLNSPSLNAAMQRAMEQLDLSKLSQLSQSALDAAQDSLSLSAEELDKLAQSMQDLKSLEDALKNLQMAKMLADGKCLDGEACKDCKSMADYAALYAALCKNAGVAGPGMGPNAGRGAGGKAPEDDSLTSAFKTEKEQSKFAGGKTILQWKTKEVGETGARAEDYREAVRDVKQRVSEAIVAEQVPPGYHSAIQKYFDSLPEK